jgi:hypothetical protein
VRTRFLARAVERANASLAEDGGEPIQGATPHGLRRTFVSLLLPAGADVPYVMAQAGHSDPKMTLGIYAKVIASATDHGAALDELVRGADWALMGTSANASANEATRADSPERRKPRRSGAFDEAADGIRTHDLLHGKQTL